MSNSSSEKKLIKLYIPPRKAKTVKPALIQKRQGRQNKTGGGLGSSSCDPYNRLKLYDRAELKEEIARVVKSGQDIIDILISNSVPIIPNDLVKELTAAFSGVKGRNF